MELCKECLREFESLDSLRRHRSQKHSIKAEQTYIDYLLNGVTPKCLCGCGEKPKYLGIETGFRDYKLGHAARVNNNWGHNAEVNKKSHATQKKMYQSGELTIWNKGLGLDDERVRNNIEKVMANPNRGNNISKALSNVPKSEEHKAKLKTTAITRWLNPDEKEKQSHRRMKYIIRSGFETKSKLEDVFVDILSELGFKEHTSYYRQYYVREIKALFDFKISGVNLLIEVDGDFWHCNPDSKFATPTYAAQKSNLIQDKIKSKWCDDNNFKLLRFWETDINQSPQSVITKLREVLHGPSL